MKAAKDKYRKPSVSLNKLEFDCQECGHPFEGKDVNINSTMAKCSNCGTVYFMEDKDFFLNDRPDRPEMMIPEGTEVLHLPSSLDIRIKNLSSVSKSELFFKTIFTVFWNVILFTIVGGMIFSGGGIPLLFLSLHFIVGIVMGVNLIQTFVNYTDIEVDHNDVVISHKPISGFWNRPKSYPKEDIDQIYVSKYVSSRTNGNPNYAYGLYAILKRGKKVQLLKGMNRETQLYLEQELERYIGIEDMPVAGEEV